MKLTDSQQAAVEHRGSDLLVSASAGSGKTEVLSRRCVSLVADPASGVGIDRLLVVTFTRAAAAELRVRIGAALRSAAREARDPEVRRHLLRQQVLVEAAEIGTIDSWCGRLVREHYDILGIDPALATISPDAATILREETLDELMDCVYTQDEPVCLAAREWVRRSRRPNDEFLRGLIRSLNRFREQLVNPVQWMEAQAAAAAVPAAELKKREAATLCGLLRSELEFQARETQRLCENSGDEHVRAALGDYAASLADWCGRLRKSNALSGVLSAIAAYRFLRKPRNQEVEEHEAARLKEVSGRWFGKRLKESWPADAVDGVLAQVGPTAELLRTLLELEKRYQEALTAAKRRMNVLEFADVQALALDLLGTVEGLSTRRPTEVALRLQERYAQILVDEFQDTNPVQVELLRLVGRVEGGDMPALRLGMAPGDVPALRLGMAPGTAHRAVARREGNRFLVGDVKQSIYGFRRAEPRLFAELAEQVRSEERPGRLLPLADNFRSHAQVLDVLNEIFAALFCPELGGTTYGELDRLAARRAELENPTLDAEPRVEVHVIPATAGGAGRGGSSADGDAGDDAGGDRAGATAADNDAGAGKDLDAVLLERMQREALIVAERVNALLGSGAQTPQRQPDGSTVLRPIGPGDIVVLLRAAAGNAEMLAGALREAGVACVAAGKEPVLERIEVQDLINVLRLLCNRRQDLPLAAYLRGPIVGLSDADLLDIRRVTSDKCQVTGDKSQTPVTKAKCLSHDTCHLSPTLTGPDFLAAVEAYIEPGPPDARDKAGGRDERIVATLRHALARLDHWLTLSRERELTQLVRTILRESGLLTFAAMLEDGPQRVACLQAMESIVADFAADGAGVADLVEYLDGLAEQEMQPGVTPGTAGQAVRVMTIHASKGLEFPVVVLANCGARFRVRGAPLVCDERAGVGLTFYDHPARRVLENAAHSAATQAIQQRELDEELRLLYVALTRAREKLIVVGHGERSFDPKALGPRAGEDAPPLPTRLSAASMLEWVLMALAARGMIDPDDPPAGRVPLYVADVPEVREQPQTRAAQARPVVDPATPITLDDADERWIGRARTLIAARPKDEASSLPGVVSVTAARKRLRPEATEDAERPLVFEPHLRAPRLALGAASVTAGTQRRNEVERATDAGREAPSADPDAGRLRGTAVHKFLQFCDLSRLDGETAVGEQLQSLAAGGRLSAEEAALVDAAGIAWLGASPVGALLRRRPERCRRELPFVYGLPVGRAGDRVLLRGVVDCLVDGDDGLVLIDYKTDRIAGDEELQSRVRQYAPQVQLYAAAVRDILSRPVAEAVLVFLDLRQIRRIDVDEASLAAAAQRVTAIPQQ